MDGNCGRAFSWPTQCRDLDERRTTGQENRKGTIVFTVPRPSTNCRLCPTRFVYACFEIRSKNDLLKFAVQAMQVLWIAALKTRIFSPQLEQFSVGTLRRGLNCQRAMESMQNKTSTQIPLSAIPAILWLEVSFTYQISVFALVIAAVPFPSCSQPAFEENARFAQRRILRPCEISAREPRI